MVHGRHAAAALTLALLMADGAAPWTGGSARWAVSLRAGAPQPSAQSPPRPPAQKPQPPVPKPGQPPPTPPAAPPQQTVIVPPPQSTAPGTGRIAGRVLAADNTPISRARVELTSDRPEDSRVALTKWDGSYELDRLRAGSYTVTASKTAFVPRIWGQRRTAQSGTPIQLREDEQVDRIDFRLLPAGAIEGRVFDEDGEPLSFATVEVMTPTFQEGQRTVITMGSDQTDDRGAYRVFGLPPGPYYVAAYDPAFTRVDVERNSYAEFAPTYYPGVMNLGEAQRLRLDPAAEIRSIDVKLRIVPHARISGRLVTDPTAPLLSGSVIMTPASAGGVTFGQSRGASMEPEGGFTFTNVPPGKYIIRARGETGSQLTLFATFMLQVDGKDISNIVMHMNEGAMIGGELVFEGKSPKPLDITQIWISTPFEDGSRWGGDAKGRVFKDGTFLLNGVLGGARYIRAEEVPAPWAFKNVLSRGRDISDIAIDIDNGQKLADFKVVLTDTPTELSGIVRNERHEILTDAVVIAFATDSLFWKPDSRYVRTARPDLEGRYQIRGLPPGQYYLVAVTDVDEAETYQSEFLGTIQPRAMRVPLAAGERRTQDVTLAPDASPSLAVR